MTIMIFHSSVAFKSIADIQKCPLQLIVSESYLLVGFVVEQ